MGVVRKLKKYCKEVNNLLLNGSECDIRNMFDTIYENMERDIPDSALYYNRKVFVENGFDFDKCRESLFQYPYLYKCEMSDDLDEHPGLVIKFKEDKEEW